MKRNILLIMFCFIAVVGFGQDKKLTILHTNDTHSQIYPLSPNLADTMKADRGGFVRRIAMLKEERAKNPDLLLFDSGDFSQGSPYYTMFKGDVEVGLMNQMHYDAANLTLVWIIWCASLRRQTSQLFVQTMILKELN